MFHEVQRGDALYSLARDYSRAFHMDISWTAIRDANKTAVADGITPGELLRIPGLEDRTDAMFLSAHPDLRVSADKLVHVVAPGQTLSSIARHYADAEGLSLTWNSLYVANRDLIGGDPNVIRPGQELVIPGITTRGPWSSLRTMSDLDGQQIVTRTARVRHENGEIETIDISAFTADGSHAQRIGTSAAAAVDAAKAALAGADRRSSTYAVTQARDGAYWMVPLNGSEISDNLDHTDQTLSLAYRANDREVVALVDRTWTGTISARRYDQ